MADKKIYDEVIGQHRRTLDRLIERGAVERVRRVYQRATAEVLKKLANIGPLKKSLTEMQLRQILAQLISGQIHIAGEMAATLSNASREAQIDSLHSLLRGYKKLERHFTGKAPSLPIEEAARFAGLIDKRRGSLLEQHESSMRRYGRMVVAEINIELKISLAAGETLDEARDRVDKVIDGETWQAERIARTETSWAANITHVDGIKEIAQEVPDLYQQWIENCDASGQPNDHRVGVDSLAMHLQLAKPGGMFTMPAHAPVPDAEGKTEVSKSLVGESWAAPPCRPNGRETVAPWRRAWGMPGWEYRDGQRHWLVRRS